MSEVKTQVDADRDRRDARARAMGMVYAVEFHTGEPEETVPELYFRGPHSVADAARTLYPKHKIRSRRL